MGRGQGRDWNATIERLYVQVPAAKDIDWDALFRADPALMGGLINDIIKVSVSEKGRPGKRSVSSASDIEQDLAHLTRDDFTDLPFHEAMQLHMRNRSVRQIANLSGLNKDVVQRLINGRGGAPTPEHMEAIAKALKKDPGYFREYRAAYVCAILYDQMVENPQAAVIHYTKLRNNGSSRKAK